MNILFWIFKSRVNKKGNAPVKMRITINGERTDITTGIEMPIDKWNTENQQVNGKDELAVQYNNTILTLRSLAWERYNYHLRNKIPVSAEIIKDYILLKDKPDYSLIQAIDYQINNLKSRIGNDIAPNTVKKYETCKRKVEEFLKLELKQEDILLSNLSQKFIYQMDAFLKARQKLSHNAVAKNMQQLKRVVKVAVQNEWISKDPFTSYTCSPKETERGFLTTDELDILSNAALPSQRLERVQDIFLFCCYTGLAYADVSKLTKEHFIKGVDNNLWIVLARTKSKTQSFIPILPQAMKILDKYRNENSKQILPVISNQNLNKYLKEIAVICGINKRLSMHLARHTFATTVTLEKGIDISTVSKMLGHKNIRTTQIYSKVTELKIATDIQKLMNSEKGKT